MEGVTFDLACTACGETHGVRLDASGHYDGPLPCDPTKRLSLQVEPAWWRRIVDAQHAKAIH